MFAFLLPLASKVIIDAVSKIPENEEVNTCLHILKKAVSMTSTKVDDELLAVVEKALSERE